MKGSVRAKWAALALIALYTSTWMFLTRDLTFYWDDYFILDSQFNDSLLELIASGVNGNWWPLSTLVTWIEIRIFGTWYAGYILVNTVLSAINGLLLWMITRELVPRKTPWYLLTPLFLYPLTLQVSVNSTVLTSSWPISVTFALLAALAIIRRYHPLIVVIFMAMSWLAMSGMFLINAVTVASVALVHWARAGKLSRRHVLVGISIIAFGIGGTLIGYQVMRYAPSNDLAPPALSGSLLESLDAGRLLESVASLSTSWLLSPIIPFAYVHERVLTTAAIFVATYVLILIALSLVLGIVGFSLIKRSSIRHRFYRQFLPLTAVLIGPVVLLAAVLAIARSGNMFAPRYGIMWLIPVGILWVMTAVVVTWKSHVGQRVVGLTGFGILLFAVALFPTTATQAIDVDRPRLEQSAKQSQLILSCIAGQNVIPLETMAPGLDPERFCPIMRELDAVWWFG